MHSYHSISPAVSHVSRSHHSSVSPTSRSSNSPFLPRLSRISHDSSPSYNFVDSSKSPRSARAHSPPKQKKASRFSPIIPAAESPNASPEPARSASQSFKGVDGQKSKSRRFHGRSKNVNQPLEALDAAPRFINQPHSLVIQAPVPIRPLPQSDSDELRPPAVQLPELPVPLVDSVCRPSLSSILASAASVLHELQAVDLKSPRSGSSLLVDSVHDSSFLSPRSVPVNISAPSRGAIQALIDQLQTNSNDDSIASLNHFFMEKRQENLLEAKRLALLESSAEEESSEAAEAFQHTLKDIKSAEKKKIQVLGQYYKSIQHSKSQPNVLGNESGEAQQSEPQDKTFEEKLGTDEARNCKASATEVQFVDEPAGAREAAASLRAIAVLESPAAELLIDLLLAEKRELTELLNASQRHRYSQFEVKAGELLMKLESQRKTIARMTKEKEELEAEKLSLKLELEELRNSENRETENEQRQIENQKQGIAAGEQAASLDEDQRQKTSSSPSTLTISSDVLAESNPAFDTETPSDHTAAPV